MIRANANPNVVFSGQSVGPGRSHVAPYITLPALQHDVSRKCSILWCRLDWYDKNQDKINKQCGITQTEASFLLEFDTAPVFLWLRRVHFVQSCVHRIISLEVAALSNNEKRRAAKNKNDHDYCT